MKHRTRLALVLSATAIVPLGVLGVGVRREMTRRLDRQAEARVTALAGMLQADLQGRVANLRIRLGALSASLGRDNRFRLAVRGGDRGWLLDWAAEAMAASGLAVLRLEDERGRVVSSGHFRNEFDRADPGLPAALARAAGQPVLVRLPAPSGEVTALAALDSVSLGERHFSVIGGIGFDSAAAAGLVPPGEISAVLGLGATAQVPAALEIALPYYDAAAGGASGTARLALIRDPEPVRALRRSVDRWFTVAALLTLPVALGLALALAARVSRPLAELAEKTGRLDLDRLDLDFATDRDDEVGTLANLLGTMTGRLRASAARLREAERRAATGELARQINHDVKNGLAPIRHVLRHLTETAAREPDRLAAVFAERRETLESSVAYLESLARNYARLAPQPERGPTDLGALLQDIARGIPTEKVEVLVRVPFGLRPVRADAVSLRRIVENLVSNAVDSLEGKPGRILLASEDAGNGAEPRIRLLVQDTGRGMTAEELAQAFDDFHTTKPAGTGLGLSVVRRLVGDLGGNIRVETRPGEGSTFILEIPAA